MNASIQSIKKQMIPVLESYGVKKAGIFGSFVRGEARKDSDIDILVEFVGNKSLLDLVDLKLTLEKRLEKKVDVLTYNSLHPLLKKIILNEQKIIYEKA